MSHRMTASGEWRSNRMTLVAMAAALIIVNADLTSVNVALPALREEFGLSLTASQWVVSAYMLAFAGFVGVAGRVLDVIGRRRALIIGLAMFALGSLLAGVAVGA